MRLMVLPLVFSLISGIANAADVCDLSLFTKEEIGKAYGGASRVLQEYSDFEASALALTIEKNARKEAHSGDKPCLPATRSCFGSNEDWYFNLEKIADNFGNVLRSTGEIESKHPSEWKTDGKTHVTFIKTACAWGGGLKSQCVKYCTMVDTTTTPGD